MRARYLLAVLSLFASACTFLFPLDGILPADTGDAGAADVGSDASSADGAPLDVASDAPAEPPLRAYAAEVLADGPVLYLRLGEKSGATARDEAHERSATYGAQVTLGAPGAIANDPDTAATFNGKASSTISLPSGFDFPGKAPFTVELWARQTTANEYGWAVDHQVYGTRNSWSLRFSKTLIAFERWADNDVAGVVSPAPLKIDTYQHVVATYDGAVAVLYVDGREVHSSPSAIAMHPMTTSWSLGAQNCACNSSDFIGSLDELAVYDKALDAARVLAHFHASGR